MKSLCFFLSFFAATTIAKGQNPDSILRKIATTLNIKDSVKHSDLFVHVDKGVYRANENLWFAAYLMRAHDVQDHHTLYITLVNEMDYTVVSSYKFALEQGIASASLPIPDSLLTGKYCLLAYTNKNIEDDQVHIFRQPIDIIGLRKDPFTLQVNGSIEGNDLLFTAIIKKTKDGSLSSGNVSFSISADGVSYKKFNEVISKSGEIRFSIPATLAVHTLEIIGVIRQDNDKMAFRRPLVYKSSKSFINYYPPYGKLITGKPSQVAVHVRNSSGESLSRTCILTENNVAIASFSTNRAGNGSFLFTPAPEKRYLIKFKDDGDFPIQTFPPILTSEWDIRPINSVAKDTLSLVLSTMNAPGDCYIVIHNSRSILYGAYIKLRKSEMLLKVPVVNWEPGIAHVCLYNKDEILQEERLIFVQNSENVNAVLQPDSSFYHPLSKVTIKLKLKNNKGQPAKGIFSFSSVLENAMSPECKNIESFNLYERFLPDEILLPSVSYLKSEQNIQGQLLKQENVIESGLYQSSDQVRPGKFDGNVLYFQKRPSRPVKMMLVNGPMTMLETDKNGNFSLPYLPLRGPIDKEIMLSVLAKNQSEYLIQLKDRWFNWNSSLATHNLAHDYFAPDEFTAKERQIFTANTTLLKEVKITARKTQSGDFDGKANSSGVCTDYVCRMNVLNCPIHPAVKQAIDGEEYFLEMPGRLIKVVYHCQYKSKPGYLKLISPTVIYTPFTPFNPKEPNPQDVLNNTTLHWQAFIETDSNGEASISFNNNARTGRYKAIVQGLTFNGVFSSAVSFDIVSH